VQELDHQLHDINASIDAEKQSIHVLKAEWVYLSNPTRLAAMSHRHLALRTTSPTQVATLDALAEILPTRKEAMAAVAVNATPVATVRSTLAANTHTAPTAVSKPALKMAAALADRNSGHVRDRMVMVQQTQTASAAPLPGDSIGNLISELNRDR
jgi:hypothetical protein